MTAETPRPNRPTVSYKRYCLECGTEFQAFKRHGEFCSTTHRKAWNNRRMIRGAELYDLFMACRHERGAAKLHGYWNLMCRMASAWRDEDDRDRGGRKSWVSNGKLQDRLTPYRAVTLTGSRRR
jgi:hypothetical protein